ncbi:quinone oxidoreductase [Scheffersomyces xylosifermentans]|uniref:quinone oxidoreductase n=1 Tax=Scheffersomyces xylosifermentans TaxID=1304137 RepID=UPI00315DFCDD
MSIPTTTTKILLKHNPTTEVNYSWGQEDSTFEIAKEAIDASSLKEGQSLVKVLYLSNDPTQRTWMQKGINHSRAYTTPMEEGKGVLTLGLAEVVATKSSKVKVGDIVNGKFQWADYTVIGDDGIFNVIDQSKKLPLPYYLSVLGMTAVTAYFGLTEVGKFQKPKEGEKGPIVAVSAASGATGSMVVQIAKHVLGASKVIGISGSDEKCKWVESIGADISVNYNNPQWKEELSKDIGTDYVDIYFDNVGGEILSFMLTKVKRFGHVVACGAIAGYNDKENFKVSNWGEIISNSLTVQGFIVGNYMAKIPQAMEVLGQAIVTGKIKVQEGFHVEDISGEEGEEKFKKVPEIWKQLFSTTKPNGKLITKIN